MAVVFEHLKLNSTIKFTYFVNKHKHAGKDNWKS